MRIKLPFQCMVDPGGGNNHTSVAIYGWPIGVWESYPHYNVWPIHNGMIIILLLQLIVDPEGDGTHTRILVYGRPIVAW